MACFLLFVAEFCNEERGWSAILVRYQTAWSGIGPENFDIQFSQQWQFMPQSFIAIEYPK